MKNRTIFKRRMSKSFTEEYNIIRYMPKELLLLKFEAPCLIIYKLNNPQYDYFPKKTSINLFSHFVRE